MNWWGDDPKCGHGGTYRTCQQCYTKRMKDIAKESKDDKLYGHATHRADQESGNQGNSSKVGCLWLIGLMVFKATTFLTRMK